MRKPILAIFAVLAASALPAGAASPQADWPVIASAQDGNCALEVTGNGKFFLIAATGLGAGEDARYRIENGGMKPIDWTVRASDGGRFARYYLPFHWGQGGDRIAGGLVAVSVSSGTCSLNATFPWRRGGVRVID
ncbi:MAG: hypothetical protein JSR28_11920 [Proteobacteria bacterium]|nr:hypothetical protein [Pseudomonadota bacterium]